MQHLNTEDPDIVIYGGCFDPPHQGHIDFVKALKNRCSNSEILILPSYSPVIAGGGTKTAAASFEHRVNMCQLAFGLDASISTLESELPTPNFTVNTLQVLRDANLEKKLSFAIGQDQMVSFDRWYQPEGILQHHDLYVAKRRASGSDSTGSIKDSTIEVIRKLGKKFEWNEQTHSFFFPEWGHSIILLDTELSDAESTSIRRFLNESPNKLPSQWLPESILSYISKHHMYTNPKKVKNGTQ